MMDAPHIAVTSNAARWFDHEGETLHDMFLLSPVVACLVGLLTAEHTDVSPHTAPVVVTARG